MSLHGQFKIAVHDSNGKLKQELGWTNNLVLKNFFHNNMKSTVTLALHLGTGTTAPTINDLNLANKTTYIYANSKWGTADPTLEVYRDGNFIHREVTMTFTASRIGTFTELGLAWDYNALNSLVTRALIKDSQGNPTTLTLVSGDILTVTYKLRVSFDISNPILASKVVTIGGVATTCTLRLVNYAVDITGAKTDADMLQPYPLTTIPAMNPTRLFGVPLRYSAPVVTSASMPNYGDIGANITVLVDGYSNSTLTSATGDGVSFNFTSCIENASGSNVFSNGVGTGVWGGILFGASGLNVATADNIRRCGLLLEFNPKIDKTALTAITFNTATVSISGGFL